MTELPDILRQRGTEMETAVRTRLAGLAETVESPVFSAAEAVFIPTESGYAELDALLICRSGIFVFECKHLTGTVLGKPSDRMWTKTGTGMFSFQNPILQSRRHADSAAAYFGTERSWCISFAVVNDECILASPESEQTVLRTSSLNTAIGKLLSSERIPADNLQEIISRAKKLSGDEKTRQKHLNNISAARKEKRSRKKGNIREKR